VLHVVLVLRRLGQDDEAARKAGQQLFDVFCRDLDHNLREMGTGDVAVPREMRRFGEAFYGRQAAYDAALAGGDPRELENTLARNIFAIVGVDDRAVRLARYALAAAARLGTAETAALVAGNPVFPSPEDFAHA